MGGSGKTTMVEEIARQVKGDKFDEIVFGTVSEKPDFIGIQDQIAKYLGFEFKNKTSANVRADELYERLLQSEKQNLVVLDDVWQCFDLVKDIGIPFGVENKKCKVVLTSRDKGVCEAMKCMDILEIKALLYEEAWTLFRDMVGDSVYNPDVHETASQIVQKCGGLPIAIVVLGNSLKGKRVEVWNNTLLKLQKASVPTNIKGMKEGVYQSLKSSYDLLEDKEAKKLFLLCCLFPEDTNIELEVLFRYGMGLHLFEDGEYLTEARCSLITLIEQLKTCYLLLDGSHEFAVKVHDIVRVVGLSITAATEHMVHDVEFRGIAIHGQQWPNSATYQHYNAISVVSSKIKELAIGGHNCPKLEVLQIACRNLSEEFFNSVFEGMKGLKVVDIWGMGMPLLPSSLLSLANLRVLFLDCGLSAEGFNTTEGLVNLEILTLVGVEELPKEIGNLAKLRLLDLSRCYRLKKISAGVLPRLKLLAELHTGGMCWGNEEEDEENGGSPAMLTEVEALPNLIYLGIRVDLMFIRNSTVLTKLQRYDIAVNEPNARPEVSFFERSLSLNLSSNDTKLEGALGQLLMDGPNNLDLKGDGLKIGLDKLVLGGHRRLRKLTVRSSGSEEVDCLVKCTNTTCTLEVFTELEKLHVEKVKHLKHIVSHDGLGLAKGSFGNLRELQLSDLPAMTCPFTYSVAVNLVHLQKLHIKKCDKMEKVFFNPGSSGIASDGSRIVFMKLEELVLETSDSLTCFCQGIEHVDFPQLKRLELYRLPLFQAFCLKETVLSLEGNHDGSSNLQLLFNHKVMDCNLIEDIRIFDCDSLRRLFSSSLINSFLNLESVRVSYCEKLEAVIAEDVEEEGEEDTRHLKHTTFNDGLEPEKESSGKPWKLSLEHLPAMTCLFTYPVTIKLMKLQRLSISNCKKMAQVVLNPRPSETTSSGKRIVFTKLEELVLENLRRLTSFCQGIEHVDFLQLKQMKLVQLPSFQAFCLEENHGGSSNLQPLFNGKVMDCSLIEDIKVSGCHSLRQLFSSSMIIRFLNLESIKVSHCEKLEVAIVEDVEEEGEDTRHLKHTVFMYPGAINLAHLKKLSIKGCGKMAQVVLSRASLRTTSSGKQIVFTKLEDLVLEHLGSLTCFCQGIEQVDFQQLKRLELGWLPSFQALCLEEAASALEENQGGRSNLQPMFDDKVVGWNVIEHITVQYCANVRQLFSSLEFKRLLNLKFLLIMYCEMLEVVIAADYEEGEEVLTVGLEKL